MCFDDARSRQHRSPSSFPPSAPQHGRTALHAAAEKGHIEVAKLLVSAGADVNATDKVRSRQLNPFPFPPASRARLPPALQDHRTPLHKACERGWLQVAAMLLENKSDVDARDALGRTPLHAAAERGQADTARVLGAHGASLTALDKAGRTPDKATDNPAVKAAFAELVAARAQAGAARRAEQVAADLVREEEAVKAAKERKKAAAAARARAKAAKKEADQERVAAERVAAERDARDADEATRRAARPSASQQQAADACSRRGGARRGGCDASRHATRPAAHAGVGVVGAAATFAARRQQSQQQQQRPRPRLRGG